MPILINGKTHQWAQFGKPLDLGGFSVQKINVTIEFPHTTNSNGKFDCKPLTVNLLKDIGVSPSSKVYCVKWGDNRPETDTMSNGYIVYRHEHTYEGPKDVDTYSHTYTITLYGMQLLPFKGNVKQVGTPPNGFKITSVENTYLPKRSSRFISFGAGIDHSIYNGARIIKGWLGRDIFYHRDIQGTAVVYEIVISGSNEVRLVNPLVRGNTNWEDKRTSVMVDWGDGERTIWYNKKINSGLFNADSNMIPKHTYEAVKGDRFVITVESIEPLVPIGCNVIGIDGTFPEDCYTETPLFNYTDDQKTAFPFRADVENIRKTTITLGGGLLANWIDIKNMGAMFAAWDSLINIGEGFFGDNILNNVSIYTRCFYHCDKLRNVPEYLLGETNDVVTSIDEMFCDTNVNKVIKLKTAKKLKTAYGMYARTDVKEAFDFLEDAPELANIGCIFLTSNLNNHSSKMFGTSSKIWKADSMFSGSKIECIKFSMKHWRNIKDIYNAFSFCPLRVVEDDTFGGDFGKDSPNGSIKLSDMFRYVGTDDVYTEFKPNVFKPFANLCTKIHYNVSGMFYGARIQKLHDGMFDNMFRHWKNYDETQEPEARFELTDFFNKLQTKDEFGYDIRCINVPRMFRNGFGIKSIAGTFSYISIGYMDEKLIQDIPNATNLMRVFTNNRFRTKISNNVFKGLRKIDDLYEAFHNVDYSFWKETSLDRILYVNGNHDINCEGAFDLAGTQKLRIYRLFANDSNFTGRLVTTTGELFQEPSLPTSVIINGVDSDIADLNSYTIRPLILYTVATNNTITTLSNGTTADIAVDGSKSTVSLPHTLSLNKGNHKIEIISETAVIADGNDFFITAIDGEYPYNSVIPDYPDCYTPREIGQYVYAVCDANSVHSKNRLRYIPILHKNIFDYHDKVSKTNFMSTTDNLMKSAYGLQPRIYHHMYRLTTFDNMFNTSLPVISDIALPQLGKDISANLLSSIDSEEFVTTNIHAGDMKYNGKLTSLSFGKSQVNVPVGKNNPGLRKKDEYLEMRIEGATTALKLEKLIGDPTFPITVETISKGQIKPSKHVINAFSDTINITGDYFVRIYSNVPVWVNIKQNITELYGVIPPCNSFTPHFKDIAPNLKRVGSLIFIRCNNSSFTNTFRGLKQFEYFPGTLFWYNYNATNYESCFADCPKLFKVDDYIITDKIGDINCRAMFANSGVTNVRRPIADDIMGKVNISGMFSGCKTDFYYGWENIDEQMFRNIDTYGKSGIVFSGNNSTYSDLDRRYVCLDPSKNDMAVSYFVPEDLLHSDTTNWDNLKYMSQSLCNQTLDINNKHLDPNKHITRYLPFLSWIDTFATDTNSNIPDDFYMYSEFLKNSAVINYTTPKEFPKLAMWRNENIVSISGAYQGSKFVNTNIVDTIPFDCGSLMESDLTYARETGLTVNSDWKMPKNVLRNAESMFEETNISFSKGAFDDIDKNGLGVGQTNISNIFKGNKAQTVETGIFKAYGLYLNSINTGVYWGTSIKDASDTFDGCDLEVIDNTFKEVTTLTVLPQINHMTKLYSYQHIFERSGLTDIPENYIYTSRNDRDIMIDYMFADCASLFISNPFIDTRCTGSFSIDYSLNNVLSGIGDDPNIFGHIAYDKDPEHRSRVMPFDNKIVWTQIIETKVPNVSVRLEGLYNENLVGFDPKNIMTIMWDNGSVPVVVSDGSLIEEQHITYTYEKPGRHKFMVMLENDACYLPTPIDRRDEIITVDLPTSFKFGKVADIRDKGLYNMFGDGVEHVSKELFNNLDGVSTIEVYNDMFKGFKNLSNLEPGILDCMPNIKVMKNFLYDSKGSTELTLKSNLLGKLTKLTDIENFAYMSNVSVVESGLFNNNTGITSLLYTFADSKVTELPRDLLNNLTDLTNINCLLMLTESFILDESYNDFFINNTNIEFSSQTFLGVKINAIPTNLMKPLINLVNAAEMFTTAHHIDSTVPWDTGDEEIKVDTNNYDIPDGFLSNNTKLQYAENMFAGRKSLKAYPANLLSTTKALINTRCMFMQTGITEIHRGTFDGYTNNIDVNFMFYGCSVGDCQSPIINSTGTFKTYGMLFGATGEPTEAELFSRVKTDPVDIQSMYRQGFEYYIVDVNVDISGTAYLKALEPSTFPWNDYVMEVDYQDNNPITIDINISNQEDLTRLTSRIITTGARTIKIKVPFAVEIGGVGVTYKRLYGVFGRMATNDHIQFRNTGYRTSQFVIDDDNFYKRNIHLTSINHAFSETGIGYVKTNAFSQLPNVTTMVQAFYSTPNFKIKDGYKPNFDHMKLTDITESFFNDLSLIINKDWEPFMNVSTIVKADRAFALTGIITTPYINTTSLTSIKECYWLCSDLTTTYANILDGASKCSNYFSLFRGAPKLTTIEGESDIHSIGDTPITNVVSNSEINYSHMFENTGLKQQQIIRIVNNLGGFKSTLPLHIYITEMFKDTSNTENNDARPELRIRSNDKLLTAKDTFYNTRLTNVPNQAITLTGNSSMDLFDNMFYNCFAAPEVEVVANVFDVQGQPANTEWNDSKLNTLNVLKVNVTPKKVEQASVMMINTNSSDSLTETVSDRSIPTYSSGDSITDTISDSTTITVNKSDTSITESIKEE